MLVPFPFLPSPSRRRYSFPHVFRFNGCWSLFRSLLFAFRRFRSFPRSPQSRFPRTGHPLTLRAHPLDAHTSNSASLWYPACQDITFRRQFSVSFSHRSECFFIALRCFRVSSPCLPGSLPWGSRTCVSKGVEGKSPRRYIHTNILHPHPPTPPPFQHPHSTSIHPRLFPSLPRPPVIHQVADCLFISLFASNCCDLSCAGPPTLSADPPTSSLTSWAWNTQRKHYYKHILFVVTFLLPAPPRPAPATIGYLSPFTLHCSPRPPAPPCIKYFHYPSSLLASSFLGLLVVLLVLFGCFRVPSAYTCKWRPSHVKMSHLFPLTGIFIRFCLS